MSNDSSSDALDLALKIGSLKRGERKALAEAAQHPDHVYFIARTIIWRLGDFRFSDPLKAPTVDEIENLMRMAIDARAVFRQAPIDLETFRQEGEASAPKATTIFLSAYNGRSLYEIADDQEKMYEEAPYVRTAATVNY